MYWGLFLSVIRVARREDRAGHLVAAAERLTDPMSSIPNFTVYGFSFHFVADELTKLLRICCHS